MHDRIWVIEEPVNEVWSGPPSIHHCLLFLTMPLCSCYIYTLLYYIYGERESVELVKTFLTVV